MKKIFLIVLILLGLTIYAEAGNRKMPRESKDGPYSLNDMIDYLVDENEDLNKNVSQLQEEVVSLQKEVGSLQTQLVSLEAKNDSMYKALQSTISSDTALVNNNNNEVVTEKIQAIETASRSNVQQLTIWIIGTTMGLLIVVIFIFFVIHRRIAKYSDTISSLQESNDKLEEELVRIKNKLIEVLKKSDTNLI
ncbi:MAG: hypothetical protein K2M53_00435 [Muribaculaceae bacterium]|nr:hypothetical protein [Muribaculaceae bacterium]